MTRITDIQNIQNIQNIQGRAVSIKKQDIRSTAAVTPDIDFGKIPLYFITNKGQVDQTARYYAKASRYTLWLTKEGLVFDSSMRIEESAAEQQSRRTEKKGEKKGTAHNPAMMDRTHPGGKVARDVSRLIFLEANKNPEMTPIDEAKLTVNYFKGNDKSKWYGAVPTSMAVLYKSLYKNIDLKVYGLEKQIEYDWIVKTGGDPQAIRFEYENTKGTRIDEEGNLLIETDFGELMHKKPFSYQEIDGKRQEVAVSFKKLAKNSYGFEVAEYDRNRELIIDPVVLAYSTYLAGSGGDNSGGIAIDASGYIYVTGMTTSSNFPTRNGFQGYRSDYSYDIYITKLDPSQSGSDSLIYSTRLGGEHGDYCGGIAVDNHGNAYVTGWTSSKHFPLRNHYQDDLLTWDAFVTKVDTTLTGPWSFLYSTYLGGKDADYGVGIAADDDGMVYVTGYTSSTDFPTRNAYQEYQTDRDAFVTKLDTTKSGDAALVYSTCLGGNARDFGRCIATAGNGQVVVSGWTYSITFPLLNPYQTEGGYDNQDLFVSKLDTTKSGSAGLLYSTYLGGGGQDYCFNIVSDSSGKIYVVGHTSSTDFPTLNPLYQENQGETDVFFAKLDPAKSGASSLLYSTYLGGSGTDYGFGIDIDGKGNVFLSGETWSPDFPTLHPYQLNQEQGEHIRCDAFVTGLTPAPGGGYRLLFSTYLSGSINDTATGIVSDGNNNVYVSGNTLSPDFPTVNQLRDAQSAPKNGDAFVSKFSFDPPEVPEDPEVIPPAERQFLIDLYNDAGGDSWTNNTGWKDGTLGTDGFAEPGSEGNWFGVITGTVNGQKHLLQLDLKYNNLQGSVPPFLRTLPYIRHLRLQGNNLTGGIPAWMGELVSLNELNLSNNGLGDTIPTELSNLTNLKTLNLAGCSLSGPIPAQLAQIENLEQLSLANNNLTGTIPVELSGLSKLRNINLGNNNLDPGPIPSWLGNMTSLQYLQLYMNNFTGTIPASLGNLMNLKILTLQSNQLSGDVPSSLMNLPLIKLSLRGNDGLFTNDPVLQAWLDALNPGWNE